MAGTGIPLLDFTISEILMILSDLCNVHVPIYVCLIL